jgi:REP element-mobilizing transposase RayT
MINLFGYVIMSNHIHLIWQGLKEFTPSGIQSSFTKYTASRFRKKLIAESPEELELYRVQKYDREYQFWKRSH